MKRLLPLCLLLLVACQSAPRNGEPDQPDRPPKEQPAIVLERDKVAEFRGVEMPDLLERLESTDPDQWHFVRRHVYPAPQPPREYTRDGKPKVNYDWPPADWNKLNPRQKAWRSYVLWPDTIRRLLQQEELRDADGFVVQDAWNSEKVRTRLARYGRMYRLVHKFQTAPQYSTGNRESEHWARFAESMLAYGEDGRELLVANMILALTNPDAPVVSRAQEVLVQVGLPAVEQLCTALWTGHNQLVEAQDVRGETIYVVQTNANFPKYIIECLVNIGPRTVGQAIVELESTLDTEGEAKGGAWRFRKNFIDLLGRFKDPRAIRAIEAEVDRVRIVEYDREQLVQGRFVVDQQATDHAYFVYREYLLAALGNIGHKDGLRAVIKIWKKDEFHEVAAVDAVLRITGKRIRTMAELRELASRLEVDLKGE
ncbi:MAG: hypothetical protein KF696_03210 [Planctomycetes bacterium]|nr:hypothetical protein [Planctomycetota bacterium]MCW8135015.1 hypothetical protein [Planctomycetota bacterium]